MTDLLKELDPPRLLPEWTPAACVLIAWPTQESDWGPSYAAITECYQAMLGKLAEAAPVVVLLHPTIDAAAWKTELEEKLLRDCELPTQDLDRASSAVRFPAKGELVRLLTSPRAINAIYVLRIAYNDTWIRDYGPLSMANRLAGSGSLKAFAFNGWGGKYPANLDDRAAAAFADFAGASLVRETAVLEGGALETDDAGNLLVNKDCIQTKSRGHSSSWLATEKVLQDQLGVKHVYCIENVALTNDDTDGHIDVLMRFLPSGDLVVSGENPEHHDRETLKALNQQAEQLAGRLNKNLLRLPTPIVHSALDGRALPATYANFLFLNTQVFVPCYGVKEDRQALQILEVALPDYRIVGVDASALIEQHGSLHCATMQIAELALSPNGV